MAAAAGGGRRRIQTNTTEDNALNMIAREAEAKLAAKRAARAEARSIRMKELERMQKEADEKMDKEYRRTLMNEEAIKKRIQSHLTTPVIPEAEVNGPVASESQLKTLQDSVQDLEQKYRSTMVNIAQLDNERQALSYQVDCLKERLEDEEETAENLRAELAQRCKEFSRLSYENKKNVEEIERLQLMLGERDRILEEHNINLEEELMGITATDGISPRTSESINMNESVEIDHSVSSGGMKSRGSSRRSSVPDDKEILLEQIRSLKEEVSELRRENDTETVRVKDVAMEEMRRDAMKLSNDLKLKIQKLEQDNARLEGNVLRLEQQVKRYRSQAEAAEAVEDTLLAEKRKIARELRQSQEHIMELETEKEHLQKRLEKLRQRKKDDV